MLKPFKTAWILGLRHGGFFCTEQWDKRGPLKSGYAAGKRPICLKCKIFTAPVMGRDTKCSLFSPKLHSESLFHFKPGFFLAVFAFRLYLTQRQKEMQKSKESCNSQSDANLAVFQLLLPFSESSINNLSFERDWNKICFDFDSWKIVLTCQRKGGAESRRFS